MSSALRRSDFSFASSHALSFPISDRECAFTLPSIISGRVRASSFLNTEICPLCSRKQKFSCEMSPISLRRRELISSSARMRCFPRAFTSSFPFFISTVGGGANILFRITDFVVTNEMTISSEIRSSIGTTP